MVSLWPTLMIAISFSSSCRSAIKASPTISFSVKSKSVHRWITESRHGECLTQEFLAILRQPEAGNVVRTLSCCPTHDGIARRQLALIHVVAESGWGRLGGRRVGIGGGGVIVGRKDRRGHDASLVLIVGIGIMIHHLADFFEQGFRS